MQTKIRPVTRADEQAFLAAVHRSRSLHRPWVSPPATAEAFRGYVDKHDGVRGLAFVSLSREGELLGVVNANEVVRGAFLSAYLGYYAFAPHHGSGHMTRALAATISCLFRKHGLHRLEANIQPDNQASLALVSRLGFRKEGLSPRYLKIAGRWRDHERWAITREEWRR